MMIGRRLSRAFGPGLFLIAVGVVLVAAGAIMDHYGLTHAEWYIGEAGIVVLTLGGVIAFAAVVAVLCGADPGAQAPGQRDASGAERSGDGQ